MRAGSPERLCEVHLDTEPGCQGTGGQPSGRRASSSCRWGRTNTAQSWSPTESRAGYLHSQKAVRKREIISRDLTVQYFKVIEVQPDIIDPEHGVVLSHPSLKVHVHLHQAGVL